MDENIQKPHILENPPEQPKAVSLRGYLSAELMSTAREMNGSASPEDKEVWEREQVYLQDAEREARILEGSTPENPTKPAQMIHLLSKLAMDSQVLNPARVEFMDPEVQGALAEKYSSAEELFMQVAQRVFGTVSDLPAEILEQNISEDQRRTAAELSDALNRTIEQLGAYSGDLGRFINSLAWSSGDAAALDGQINTLVGDIEKLYKLISVKRMLRLNTIIPAGSQTGMPSEPATSERPEKLKEIGEKVSDWMKRESEKDATSIQRTRTENPNRITNGFNIAMEQELHQLYPESEQLAKRLEEVFTQVDEEVERQQSQGQDLFGASNAVLNRGILRTLFRPDEIQKLEGAKDIEVQRRLRTHPESGFDAQGIAFGLGSWESYLGDIYRLLRNIQ